MPSYEAVRNFSLPPDDATCEMRKCSASDETKRKKEGFIEPDGASRSLMTTYLIRNFPSGFSWLTHSSTT